LKVTKTNQDKKVKLTVEIEAVELKKHVDEAYERLSKNVKVAGFRPGKAPRHLVEKEIGQDRLNAEILDSAIPNTYYRAIMDENLNVAGAPEVKLVKYVPTDTLVYEAIVELVPEVMLPELAKIKVKREEVKVADKEVEEVVSDLAKQLSTTSSVNRPAQIGDRTEINFEGFIDNLPFEGGKSENYPLILGQGNFIPGFEEQLVGMKTDEEKEIKVSFPKDYHVKDLAGKEAKFNVKMNLLEEIIMPEVTDELATKLGPFSNLQDLREGVKKQLEATKKIQERNRIENEIFEKLVEETKIEPPESLVHQEIHRLLHEAEHNLSDNGLTLERYLAMTSKTLEDLEKEMQPEAEKRVKIGLILTQIAKEIKAEATEKEIEKEIEKRLAPLPEGEKNKAKEYYQSYEGKRQVENSLIGEKVINHLYETCSK
jgi:trigger factor